MATTSPAKPIRPVRGPADNASIMETTSGDKTLVTDNGTYNVTGHQYPSDLLSPTGPYGGNYVMLYINVHESSKLLTGSESEAVVPDAKPNDRGTVATNPVGEIGTSAMVLGGASAVTGIANKVIGSATGMSAKGALLQGAVVGATAVTIERIGEMSPKYKRLEKAIALHVPTDLSIRYSVDWGTEDTAGSQALAYMAGSVGTAVGSLVDALTSPNKMDSLSKAGTAVGDIYRAGGGYVAGQMLSKNPFGDFLSKKTGVVANPKKEQLFKSVDFRTFTFSYSFFPRSAEEAQSVYNIIYALKLHMHPEYKDSTEFLYLYPSEFDIVYYQNGKENLNLHRHTSCVLTDLSINYTPQGIVATFEDGMPSQINIQMTFKELGLMSKETIQDKF